MLHLYANESRAYYPEFNEQDNITNFEYFQDSELDDILVGSSTSASYIYSINGED